MIYAPTHDERGIKPGSGQDARRHRRGGGFPVRARDGDSVFQAHQFGQHFRARNHWNFQAVGFDHFRIVARESRTKPPGRARPQRAPPGGPQKYRAPRFSKRSVIGVDLESEPETE